jgi:putative transposase
MKKRIISNENCYHIFGRSIAKYTIFNDKQDFLRFINIIKLYRFTDFSYKYSNFMILKASHRNEIVKDLEISSPKLVEIVSYCLMPTHFHLILRQKTDSGISNFMSKISNCYARYFNIKHKRKGPLWESRFNDVSIENDNQLLHLTRYLHLNPSSAGLTNTPEEWLYSSYHEFTSKIVSKNCICDFHDLLDIEPSEYTKFVNDRVDYQKQLSRVKKLLLDNYSG